MYKAFGNEHAYCTIFTVWGFFCLAGNHATAKKQARLLYQAAGQNSLITVEMN